jgi:hypothetical protein
LQHRKEIANKVLKGCAVIGFIKGLKMSTRWKKCGKTYKMIEIFSYIISITGLRRPSTGIDADNNENRMYHNYGFKHNLKIVFVVI